MSNRPLARQFDVDFATHGFTSPNVPAQGTIRFTEVDLAWALFTTGRAPWDIASGGLNSYFECIHRVAIIPAYFRFGPGNRLRRSRLCTALERSEKVGVSYALGMAMTRLFTAFILGVPVLYHAERYARRFNVVFGSGLRPDLIGWSRAGWVVAEAKGRSNKMEPALRAKLRAQKNSVVSIAGSTPALSLACVAQFATQDLSLAAFDPDEPDIEQVQYDQINIDRFVLAYYDPFLTVLNRNERIVDYQGRVIAQVAEVGMTIGLDSVVLASIEDANRGEVAGLADRVTTRLAELEQSDTEARLDGSIIEVDWGDAMDVANWEQ